MTSVFETLPTEILFEIFDYLTASDILYALINLNEQLNDVIGLYPLHLDFQHISRSKFDFVCRHIRPEQVITLYLSDEFMPDQVRIFKKYFSQYHKQFIRLKAIKFINTSTILANAPVSLSSLSIKTYLKTHNTNHLITKLLNQQAQYLTYLKVDGFYAFRSINTSFPLLKHLVIGYCTITEFNRIIRSFKSSLIYLKVFLDREEHFTIPDFDKISNSLTHLTITFAEGTKINKCYCF